MGKKKVSFLDQFKRDNNGKYIIPLKSPIQHGKETINQLEVSEPKAKHIRKMPADPDMDKILEMIGMLAGQPDSVIDELSLRDVEVVSDFIEAFS